MGPARQRVRKINRRVHPSRHLPPFVDGHFRVPAAEPHFDGSDDAFAEAHRALAGFRPQAHRI
jgi:hypothetical protein